MTKRPMFTRLFSKSSVTSLIGLGLFLALWLWPSSAAAATGAEDDLLKDGLLWAVAAAFGNGVLTSFTPCVFPMIPIIVAVFGARDESVTRARAMLLATSFVLGIATLYTALGVGFALLGKSASAQLSNPWVIGPIAGLLVVLATSMFGAFELRLPYGFQQRLNRVGGKGFGGAYALGLVLGVIAAPCTTGFAAALFTLIAKGQDVPAGALLSFVYALGIGLLFWVLAVFAVSLPKSGRWMEAVKSVGGIALIVVAAYLLIPVIPGLAALADPGAGFLLGALVLALIGLAIGAAHLSFHGPIGEKLRKGAGVVLTCVGMIGAVNWYLTPDIEIGWQHSEPQAFALARDAKRHVMIDFGADWCLPCKEIEKVVGNDELYAEIVASFVPLKLDVSEDTPQDQALQKKYGAKQLPTVVFLDADGTELGRYTDKTPTVDSFRSTIRGILDQHPL